MKTKDLREMSSEDMNKKLKELKIELIKSKSGGGNKTGSSKTREIKKLIAKILTIKMLNTKNKKVLKKT